MSMSTRRLSFFFNDTATTEIYTLSLHDALPIFAGGMAFQAGRGGAAEEAPRHFGFLCGQNGNLFWNIGEGLARKGLEEPHQIAQLIFGKGKGDRKSTRLNPSHLVNSYAVFCLQKKKGFTLPGAARPAQGAEKETRVIAYLLIAPNNEIIGVFGLWVICQCVHNAIPTRVHE